MPPAPKPVLDRILAKVRYDAGCWIYTGHVSVYGYGRVTVSRKLGPHPVHRVAYQELVGDIPPGMQIDHLCRNRACCNPLHLEAVSFQENIARGCSKRSHTHCRRGHEFTVENTGYVQPGDRRDCLTCRRARAARAHERARVANRA